MMKNDNPIDRLNQEQNAWLERHYKDADLLIFDTRFGHCKEAIYLSPLQKVERDRELMEERAKEFFRLVRELEDEE